MDIELGQTPIDIYRFDTSSEIAQLASFAEPIKHGSTTIYLPPFRQINEAVLEDILLILKPEHTLDLLENLRNGPYETSALANHYILGGQKHMIKAQQIYIKQPESLLSGLVQNPEVASTYIMEQTMKMLSFDSQLDSSIPFDSAAMKSIIERWQSLKLSPTNEQIIMDTNPTIAQAVIPDWENIAKRWIPTVCSTYSVRISPFVNGNGLEDCYEGSELKSMIKHINTMTGLFIYALGLQGWDANDLRGKHWQYLYRREAGQLHCTLVDTEMVFYAYKQGDKSI